jgi:sugar lactone lactonase YvrE
MRDDMTDHMNHMNGMIAQHTQTQKIQQITEVDLLLDAKVLLGEGPSWNESTQQLYWVDIEGCAVHVYDPSNGTDRRIDLGQMAGCVVPRRAGGVLLAMQHGFYTLDLETEELRPILDPEVELAENRFNDGKCDSRGRLWAGTTRISHDQPSGSLYCLDTDLTCQRRVADVWISNGLAWSADDRIMYFIDSPTCRVDAFDFDVESGALSNRRTVVEVPAGTGTPDGMTIDEEGMLWIALWDGWRVTRWDPRSGHLIGEIPLPVARPTSCVFGGPDLDQLYITTASTRLPAASLADQPLAGGLFHCVPGVRGLPTHAFNG